MGRVFTVPIPRVAVTAAQDLFELKAHATRSFSVLHVHLEQDTEEGDAQAEKLPIAIKRAGSGYTSGSGGSAATPQPNDGYSSPGLTAEINNTTRLSGGSLTEIVPTGWNVAMPFDWWPTPKEVVDCLAAGAIVVGLEAAPADSITVSGYATVEEN